MALNVRQAHLSEFGSRDGIAKAKVGDRRRSGSDRVAVLNADDPRVMGMAIPKHRVVSSRSTVRRG